MATEKSEVSVGKPRSLWLALALAAVLIVLPGLFVGPLFVPFVALWALPAFALSFRRKFAAVRMQRLRNLGIYILASALVVVNHAQGLAVAQARGETIVSALKAFQAANRRYPNGLEELVPKYIDRIPPALYGRFYYFNSAAAGPTFFYVNLPPFGRRGYCFAEKSGACLGSFDDHKNGWYDFD